MLQQAAILYIAIVSCICAILSGVSLYAAGLGEGNVPGGSDYSSKQYKGFGLVLGVFAIWGILIIFS